MLQFTRFISEKLKKDFVFFIRHLTSKDKISLSRNLETFSTLNRIHCINHRHGTAETPLHPVHLYRLGRCGILSPISPITRINSIQNLFAFGHVARFNHHAVSNHPDDFLSNPVSMRNKTFYDFVENLIETKQLREPYHSKLVSRFNDYELSKTDSTELSKYINDSDVDEDDEFQQMARDDLKKSEAFLSFIEKEIIEILMNSIEEAEQDFGIDTGSITLECEAGAGGVESMVFNRELFEMYRKFSDHQGWSFTITAYSTEDNSSSADALRKGEAEIVGKNVYDVLKFEAGVHRVQRIPVTEKKGKMHTSTTVVLINPTVITPVIELKPSDIKLDYFKSSGPGGQAVNTANSAVRVTHLPTGLTQECQKERTQHVNKDIALEKLKTRLFVLERDRILEKNQRQRKIQIGTRERSEKIRTYNFPQARVTDHRLGSNSGSPEKLLQGTTTLENLINSLREAHKREILVEKVSDFAPKKL